MSDSYFDLDDRGNSKGKKDKKKNEKRERRYDTYDVVELGDGYIVRLTLKSGNIFYCDRERFWMRSKVPMRPTSSVACNNMIDDFIKSDQDQQRFIRGN